MVSSRFAGIDRLYGRGAAQRLAQAQVCVVGVGGVGSWAVESLARSGVGRLVLVDADDVCVSNTNRQLHALEGQYGRHKGEVLAERCRAINPAIEVEVVPQFLEKGGALQVPDAAALEAAVASLLADPARRAELGRRGQEVVRANMGSLEKTVEMIVSKLPAS